MLKFERCFNVRRLDNGFVIETDKATDNGNVVERRNLVSATTEGLKNAFSEWVNSFDEVVKDACDCTGCGK